MDRSGGGGDGGGRDGPAALSVKLSGRAVSAVGRAGSAAAGRVGHADRGRRGRVGQHAEGDGSATGQGGDEEQQANHHGGPAPATGGGRLVAGWLVRVGLGVAVSLGDEVVLVVSAPRAPAIGVLQRRRGGGGGHE